MTQVTFSSPVEVPGRVLPPGTYVFKLLDSQVDRNIVQIFNNDQSKIFTTLLAIPDYRLRPADKTVILFEEREANAPQAVRAWFYPGENYGAEFVYPQPQAAALSKANNVPVPSMPAETRSETSELRNAPVMNQQPTGGQTHPEPAPQPAPPPQAAAQPQPPEQAALEPPTQPQSPQPQPQHRRQLPQTASDMPLIGLLGLASVGLAGVLRLPRKRA